MGKDPELVLFECARSGRDSFAVSKIGLLPGCKAKIRCEDKEDSDLSKIIKFGETGSVKTIEVLKNDGSENNPEVECYDYTIRITATGPKDGRGFLRFLDQTGDYYDLSVYSSSEKQHTVDYNSDKPRIIAVLWYDSSNE